MESTEVHIPEQIFQTGGILDRDGNTLESIREARGVMFAIPKVSDPQSNPPSRKMKIIEHLHSYTLLTALACVMAQRATHSHYTERLD